MAFSHPAVAGVALGDLWDEGNPLQAPLPLHPNIHLHMISARYPHDIRTISASHTQGSGLFDAEQKPKPVVAALDRLWGRGVARGEWHTEVEQQVSE